MFYANIYKFYYLAMAMKNILFESTENQFITLTKTTTCASHRPKKSANASLAKISIFTLFAAFSNIAQAQHYLIPTPFSASPTPSAPNYQLPQHWAALPTKSDFADRTPKGQTDNQANAPVDVFFIHPTTYIAKPKTQYLWNQDLNDESLNKEVDQGPILYQASVFNQAAKVYAPRYRQAHYSVFLTRNLNDKQTALDTAYKDVAQAFEYYLKHYNNNRPFIIASHSQGTIHAARLLKEFVIGKPLQTQLVVAYIPGMPVPTDSLPGLPICQSYDAFGCFASWSTYQRGFIPEYYQAGLARAICINPITWKYDTAYAPTSLHKGSVVKPFDVVRPQICDAQVHGGLLWITKPKFPGAFLYTNPNYHIGDFNLFYMDIRRNAQVRSENYLNKR